MIARRTAFQVCEDAGWLTNDGDTATAFGNTWVAPVRGGVHIGRLSLKVAKARLVALRRQLLRRCGRRAALSLKSHLIQPTFLMTEARPELGRTLLNARTVGASPTRLAAARRRAFSSPVFLILPRHEFDILRQ